MTGPLQGITVLDLTQLVQGPFATQILGDMGAEIIKVEPPKGDWMRHFAIDNLYIEGESISFLAFNRNKRSIVIDMKHEDGVALVKRLVEKTDVLIENFRPGVMERLGVGYETLSEINPGLIYCASSGYGTSGPYVKRPGQDIFIQAMTGIATLTGKADDDPVVPGVSLADLTAGLHIVYGVLAALYNREQTGKGQRVDVNLYSSLLSYVTQEMALYLNGGSPPQRSSAGIPNPYTGAPYGVYATADGHLAIGMNPLNKLAGLLGVTGYETVDSNNVMEERDTIKADLAAAFATRTTEQWLEVLLAEDIWCGPVLSLADVEQNPQVAANEMILSYEHPTAGQVRGMGIPIKFSQTPGEIRYPAPLKGQHSGDILRAFGLSDEEIQRLEAEGVVQ